MTKTVEFERSRTCAQVRRQRSHVRFVARDMPPLRRPRAGRAGRRNSPRANHLSDLSRGRYRGGAPLPGMPWIRVSCRQGPNGKSPFRPGWTTASDCGCRAKASRARMAARRVTAIASSTFANTICSTGTEVTWSCSCRSPTARRRSVRRSRCPRSTDPNR